MLNISLNMNFQILFWNVSLCLAVIKEQRIPELEANLTKHDQIELVILVVGDVILNFVKHGPHT